MEEREIVSVYICLSIQQIFDILHQVWKYFHKRSTPPHPTPPRAGGGHRLGRGWGMGGVGWGMDAFIFVKIYI